MPVTALKHGNDYLSRLTSPFYYSALSIGRRADGSLIGACMMGFIETGH